MVIQYPLTRTGLDLQLAAARLSFENAKRQLGALEAITVECSTCEHYHAKRCTKWNAAPPPEVLAVGCPDWKFDEIPF